MRGESTASPVAAGSNAGSAKLFVTLKRFLHCGPPLRAALDARQDHLAPACSLLTPLSRALAPMMSAPIPVKAGLSQCHEGGRNCGTN